MEIALECQTPSPLGLGKILVDCMHILQENVSPIYMWVVSPLRIIICPGSKMFTRMGGVGWG